MKRFPKKQGPNDSRETPCRLLNANNRRGRRIRRAARRCLWSLRRTRTHDAQCFKRLPKSASRESIPADSQSDNEDVVPQDAPGDCWDTSIEKYGADVVHTNASGECKLLTEYNVPSLTGLIINDLTDVNQMRSTLTSPCTWTQLFKDARASSRDDAARTQIVNQILALVKSIRKQPIGTDAAFGYKLMQDVLEKVHVIPTRISAREKCVPGIARVVATEEVVDEW